MVSVLDMALSTEKHDIASTVDRMARRIRSVSGRGILGNRTDDGIAAIESFGTEHVDSGRLIVYTSQDSVLQIAAHVDVVPPAQLYTICERKGWAQDALGYNALVVAWPEIARRVAGTPEAEAQQALEF